MNAITTTAPNWLAYSEMERLAVAIAKSGLFGIRTPEQAIVLMQIAQAEGRHPALAARDYDIIQGRPAKKAEAMHRDFLAGGGKVEWTTLTDDTADATFSHPQGGTARIIWDTDRAALAGLEKKENWKKYPRQMLRNRVVSEGVRTVWPMATSGMHLPEEIGDTSKPANDADFNGTTLEAETDEREQMNRDVPLKAAAAPMPRGARVAERAQAYEAPRPHPQMPSGPVDPNPVDASRPERTDAQWRVWIDKLRDACAVLYHRSEVVQVAERPSVANALATGPEWVRDEVSAILAENYKRFAADEPEGELPEVEIAGERNVMAG